jgi:hypothetical protein
MPYNDEEAPVRTQSSLPPIFTLVSINGAVLYRLNRSINTAFDAKTPK